VCPKADMIQELWWGADCTNECCKCLCSL